MSKKGKIETPDLINEVPNDKLETFEKESDEESIDQSKDESIKEVVNGTPRFNKFNK
jgi:hypothetical protein